MAALIPPQVTIKLSENQNVNKDGEQGKITYGEPVTGSTTRITITVTKSPYPTYQGSTANFYRYRHALETRGTKPFKLLAVHGDENSPINIAHDIGQYITSVSAYYWKDKSKEAILVEVVTTNHLGAHTYYYGKKDGNIWTPLSGNPGPQPTPLVPDDLEKKLDDLVCQHYKAVTLDLSSKNSKTYTNDDNKNNKYCCSYHNPNGDKNDGRIAVNKGSVSCKVTNHDPSQAHPSSAPFFKHEITSDGGLRVSAIKYYPNSSGPRRRINIPGLENFQNGSLFLYVFHCTGEAPILIYVEGGGHTVDKRWFKKPASSNGKDENWEALDDLNNITLGEQPNAIDCEKYKRLVEELKCSNHKDCPLSQNGPPQPPPPVGEKNLEEDKREDGEPEDDEEVTSTDSSWDLKTILGPIFGTGAPVGGGAYAGWHVYTRYFLDALVRLI
ncbi:hypothetical protein BEWA_049580 [Theileria equi strain WA]|uniref:Uncharacterized protein n=1 Tax=Theileria equi strain WA TaxID=1537102 RepID=L1LAY6_THEEQ|nr:hypothetical protein BEWA_049580 [Theileria equi strain WA]EKX72491.1 hypothetical protein BEWA_049580 [Theileria equi strain WA]|eukprot:XP_004831943.1 hypothetical protein BEWA_049580 [Theileria equi strain WA]